MNETTNWRDRPSFTWCNVTVRLGSPDLERAKRVAEAAGVTLEAWLRGVVRAALDAASK